MRREGSPISETGGKAPGALAGQWVPRRKNAWWFSYKPVLAAHDVLVALGAAAAGAWLAEGGAYPTATAIQLAFLLLTGLIPIAFFTSFRLYRYHLIHSRRFHLSRLAPAFGLSLLTFGAVVFTYTWARIMPPSWFIPIIAWKGQAPPTLGPR